MNKLLALAKRLALSSKVMLFGRDLVLTLVSALFANLAPLTVSPGLAFVNHGQWMGVLDHTASAVVFMVLALVGTPITRRYGVGSMSPAPEPPVAGPVSTPAVSPPSVPPTSPLPTQP